MNEECEEVIVVDASTLSGRRVRSVQWIDGHSVDTSAPGRQLLVMYDPCDGGASPSHVPLWSPRLGRTVHTHTHTQKWKQYIRVRQFHSVHLADIITMINWLVYRSRAVSRYCRSYSYKFNWQKKWHVIVSLKHSQYKPVWYKPQLNSRQVAAAIYAIQCSNAFTV